MKLKHRALCTALAFVSMTAQAGDNVVNFSLAHINVRSQSPDFTTNGPAFLTPQPAGLTVGDATTLTVSYARRFTDNLSAELVLGIPPKHSVYGRGTLAPYGVVSHIKQIAPTAFLNYLFGKPGDDFRPYVGIGFNHTIFFARNSTASGNLASGGPTKIRLTPSNGVAWQVGIAKKVDDVWSLTFSFAGAKVETELTASTGSIDRQTTLDLRPQVFSLGVSRSY